MKTLKWWTKEETDFLMVNWGPKTAQQISDLLLSIFGIYRSRSAVSARAFRLGLSE